MTRTGCEADFRIGYCRKLEKWIVKEFKMDHNHPMVNAFDTQFLRSDRRVTNPDQAQLQSMRSVGVKTSQIMDYMVKQSGGHEKVGFTPKDLYNHVDAMRRFEIKDGDAGGALAYLCAKWESDPSFFYKFSVDEENRVENLYWFDSTSRLDYAWFGDVVAFDTTYRTNAHKKPLVVLLAVNHHHQTVIFGCALLVDESESSSVWALEAFLHGMMSKKPISVVTDGDKAMRKAIKKVLPDAWHLQRNAFTNVHIKDFKANFARCMFMSVTPEEFELAWAEMVKKLGVHGNRWVMDVYAKRRRWAEAYLLGNFFAGMRTTQRCESMNAYLNRFLKLRLRLYEFLQHFDRALTRIRHNDVGYVSNNLDHHGRTQSII